MQTDQPYSYKVPEEFVGDAGSRYAGSCPLWKGNRLIQGIVLGLESQSDEEMEGRGLEGDCGGAGLSPVLTQEQLWLAEELT